MERRDDDGASSRTQVTDGRDAGSWNTNTVWGGYGGRVYTTAMAAMCLEVYYRYAPTPSQRSRLDGDAAGVSNATLIGLEARMSCYRRD